MKVKKILLGTSGVLKLVLAGLAELIGIMIFVVGSTVRELYSSSEELINQIIQAFKDLGEDYAYLESYSQEQMVDFVMKIVSIIAVVLIILGLFYILGGIMTIMASKKLDTISKGFKIALTLIVWLTNIALILNTLTTIGLFYKGKKPKSEINNQDIIPSFQC